MRTDYEERKAARLEAYEERAAKAQAEARARFNSHNIETLRGMAGEPVKIGHHSEKRHRRLIKRADDDMRKGVEATDRAKHYAEKITAAESDGAIRADDPQAVEKITARIAELEARQEERKRINAAHRRFVKDPATLDRSDLNDEQKAYVRNWRPFVAYDRQPFPSYTLSNANANIRRLRERLRDMSRLAAQAEQEPERVTHEGAGWTITRSAEKNRIQVTFPGKPAEDVRAALKRRGFRWAPSEKAWQRYSHTFSAYAEAELAADLARLLPAG